MVASMADLSGLPAAGAHRVRALAPREMLARSGFHTVAPPLHPEAEHAITGIPIDPDVGRHSMRFSRAPSQLHCDASMTRNMATMRPAGVGGGYQSVKTRAVFKHNAMVGQYSNDLPSAIPGTAKVYHQNRADGTAYSAHQSATTLVRKELERIGHL
mmetsp:Transcript_46142/g.103762  ORF Transcript_46142/g.103762 Transcript_46142/m.103762 type:complete len:157 (-) Transcript_46142:142-612(-)